MGQNDFILNGIKWSFSSVNAYATCPRMFKLSYIDGIKKSGNGFAEFGTFVHLILERYYTGKLDFFDLVQFYKVHYAENVKLGFPPNRFVDLAQSYYDGGLNYLTNFEDPFDSYEKIAAEKKVMIHVGGFPFVGIIDLILRNDQGNYIIVDHKSHKFASKKEVAEYARQMYLYGECVKELYGEYPVKLIFNAFREQKMYEIEWNDKGLEEAREWFVGTIGSIYSDEIFEPKPDAFFCDNICSVRHVCDRSRDYMPEPPEGR